MKIIIGIITSNRKNAVVSLLAQLKVQLGKNDYVWILENGSQRLDWFPKSSMLPEMKLFQQKRASIPVARNHLFQLARNRADIFVFLDDDVSLPTDWLKKLKIEIIRHNQDSVMVLQGNFLSLPQKNIYAQMTEILAQLWLRKNLNEDGSILILDTKHTIFYLKKMSQIPVLFDKNLKFASDIKAGQQIIEKYHGKIVFLPNLIVYHHERDTLREFLKHRYRLSKSYRTVNSATNNYFQSATLWEKISTLWQELKINPFSKLVVITTLILTYCFVFVNRSINLVRTR